MVPRLAFMTLLAVLALAPPTPAAPPDGGEADPDVRSWFRGLRSREGWPCCSIADCRPAPVQPNDDGRVLAYIGKETFGPMAPNAWLEIPPRELRSRGQRPGAVRGAIVCFGNGQVLCADLEGAT